jgi:hypothetical protein
MKLSVDPDFLFVMEEVFNPILFKTDIGETLSICQRDGGFELITQKNNIVRHYIVKEGEIE